MRCAHKQDFEYPLKSPKPSKKGRAGRFPDGCECQHQDVWSLTPSSPSPDGLAGKGSAAGMRGASAQLYGDLHVKNAS